MNTTTHNQPKCLTDVQQSREVEAALLEVIKEKFPTYPPESVEMGLVTFLMKFSFLRFRCDVQRWRNYWRDAVADMPPPMPPK